MTKNLILSSILTHLPQIWAPKDFFVGFIFASSWTLFQAIILWNLKESKCTKLQKMAKNLTLDPILTCLSQIWAPIIFLQVLPLLVVRHCSKLSSYVN